MRKIFAFSIFGILFSSVTFGTDILWLKFSPKFHYQDLFKSCSSELIGSDLYLSAEIQDHRILRARLNQSTVLGGGIALSDEEVSGIELQPDGDRVWIKVLPISPVTLNWLVFRVGSLYCKPPKSIKLIEPAAHTFRFNVDTGSTKIGLSDRAEFTGVWEGGDKKLYSYNMDLSFQQQLYPEIEVP